MNCIIISAPLTNKNHTLQNGSKNMENKFEHMSNYEIGVIAKAFMCCAECKNCPCDFVLCSVGDTKKAREDFINEFAKRVRG